MMIPLQLTPEQQRQARTGEIQLTEDQALSIRGKVNAAASGGRPPIADRCPCGLMTRSRAAKRGHKCKP